MEREFRSFGPSYPLSPGQLGLWLHERISGEQHTNTTSVELHGRIVVPALVEALKRVHQTHAMLRNKVAVARGVPSQTPGIDRDLDVGVFDEAGGTAMSAPDAFLRRRLELADGECQRAAITRRGPYQCRLDVVTHHLVCDAQSWAGVLLPQIAAHYNHICGVGEAPSLPRRTFADYLAWRSALSTRPDYHKRVAAVADHLLERGGTPARSGLVATRRNPTGAQFLVGPSASRWVQACQANLRVSPLPVLMAATYWALATVLGEQMLLIGLRMTDRPNSEFDDVCGLFVNVLPFRLSPGPRTVRAAVREAAPIGTLLLLGRHAAMSDVEAAGRAARPEFRLPLRAMMTYTPHDETAPHFIGAHAALPEREPDMAHPLEISYYVVSGQLQGSVYGSGDVPLAQARSIASALEAFLSVVPANPDTPLSDLMARAAA